VTHGLRSIMAAPLRFDGRLLGVVYLDSRVAKGIFTAADIGILTAITNHIASALETARTAALAVAVRAAEQERDLANKLREAMLDFNASLDPDDVLQRLHRTLAQLIPHDTTCLVRTRDGRMTVRPGTDPAERPQPLTAPHLVQGILACSAVVTGDGAVAPPEPLIFGRPGPDSSWLAIPLHNHGQPLGAVVLTSTRPDAFAGTEVQLAGALTSEGLLAYDNALLFAQVQAMAITDPLTGVSNRRYFFAVAEHDLKTARGDRATVMMLDIDHFKRFNDEHGHQVGDQVIRAVADRLRGTLRTTDRLGRYGGEEFAILLGDPVPDEHALGERLRIAIAQAPADTDAGPLPVTISVGVRMFDPRSEALPVALDRADSALYQAKQAGRNRVVVDAG
jgi:diguanylate cyclase (GGDEF)-like protein